MRLSQGDLRRNEQRLPPGNDATPRIDQPRDVASLVLILIVELSACLQMITSDIARSADLEEASARWLQRLMALTAMIERATGPGSTLQRYPEHHSQVVWPARNDTTSIVDIPAQPHLNSRLGAAPDLPHQI